MQRFNQWLFAASLVALSWYAMMAVHELGHVIGAIMTGGTVERVILHPLAISRTDVSPNPHPALVVWMGPIVGSLFPLIVSGLIPRRLTAWHHASRFFSGFCLIANGSYIAIGAVDHIGDCGEMVRTGTPLWAMVAFGTVAVPVGLYQWHALGSFKQFLENPTVVTPQMAYVTCAFLIVSIAAGVALSPR